MKKINKLLSISIIVLTSFSINATSNNDFFYKSKQENGNVTIYENLVTESMILEEVILNNKESSKEFEFKGLQNKKNMNNKYSGRFNIEKLEDSNNIELLVYNQDKRLQIFVNSKKDSSYFLDVLMSSNYKKLFKYLSKNNFELNLKNKNDTAYLLSLFNFENKEDLFKKLIEENSNDINEKLNIYNQGEIIVIDSYELEIENILKLKFKANIKIEDNLVILSNVVIDTNVFKYMNSFKELESVFNIDLSKGTNTKKVEKIEIKI